MDILSADKYSLCCAERVAWPPMDHSKREDKKDEIWDWLYSKLNYTNYFILLCRERNDYTVFAANRFCDTNTEKEATNVLFELVEVIDSRGNWIAADYDEDNYVWQLWVNRGEDVAVYLFFDADGFVIEC